jgi:hypothetical protein
LSGLAESVVEEHIERAIEVEFETSDYREAYDNLASYFEQMMIEPTPNENEVEKYLSDLYEQANIYVNERGVEETKGGIEVDNSPVVTSDPPRGEGGGYDEDARATRSKTKASGLSLNEGVPTGESPMKQMRRGAGRPTGSKDINNEKADKFYRERRQRQGLSAIQERHKLRGAVEPLGGEEEKGEM